MDFSIDGTFHAGDILTSVTVAISVVSLILSQAKDRRADQAELAKAARLAASHALAQLDRASRLMVGIYTEMLPEFIDLSRELDVEFDVIAARDRLWRCVNAASAKLAQTLLDEHVATAYVDLVAYRPQVRKDYADAFARMEAESDKTVDAFLLGAQKKLLALEDDEEKYTSAMAGNLLRDEATKRSAKLKEALEACLGPLRESLFQFIEQDDQAIARERPAG